MFKYDTGWEKLASYSLAWAIVGMCQLFFLLLWKFTGFPTIFGTIIGIIAFLFIYLLFRGLGAFFDEDEENN